MERIQTAILYGTNCIAAANTMRDFDLLELASEDTVMDDKVMGYCGNNKFRIGILDEVATVSEPIRRCYWERLRQICTMFSVEIRNEEEQE